jgi:serine/threonine kinase PknH
MRLAAYGEPVEGTPFGRYRLVELLGRGGMGEVWRAHDTVTDRVVAIKVLPAHLSEDEEFLRRFRREAHAAARLGTPHVVPIHDYGEIDGRLYVSMRLIEGRDLESVLADGPIGPARAVRIIEGVALALHAAHKVGLLHRDVKPSNILLDEDDFAYLIDFGIARAADETRLTKTGNTIGTFHYIAPERLGTRAEEDARADIYSLACVLYECLTGHPPFDEDTMAQLVEAHLHTPPPQPSTTQPNVSAQFDPVIATGMAKDPDQRYATTVELASAAHDAITTPIPRPAQSLGTRPAFVTSPAPPMPATEPAAQQQPADLNLAATPQRPPDGPPPDTGTPPPQPWWQRQRREVKLGIIAAVVVILAAGTGITGYVLRPHSPASPTQTAQPSTTSQPTTTSRTVAPVAEAALQGLLLSPDQINTAMGATGMTVAGTLTATYDSSADVPDKACLPQQGPAETPVYAGSGWTALRGQVLREPGASVTQDVVLFSSAHDADAFFTASTQQWPACANRQYTSTVAGKPDAVWTVGPVSNTNGTLSATATVGGGDSSWTWNWMSCQRALTVANNVAIDTMACSQNRSDAQSDSAVNIAHQIAAKVPT